MKKIMQNCILMCRLILALSFFITAATSLFAQTVTLEDSISLEKPAIFVKARTYNSQIDIRWAPSDHLLFRNACALGYRLERWDGEKKEWKVLFDRAAYSVEEFKAKLDTANAHVATAAQCIHGAPQGPSNPSDPFAAMKEIEDEQKMRFAFALLSADYNAQAAEGLALSYHDKDIEDGKSYVYRLFVRDLAPGLLDKDTVSFMVNTNMKYKPIPVEKVFGISEPESNILKWNKEINNTYFSGYFVERSIDKGKTFQRLNQQPMLTSDHETFEEFTEFNIYSDKDIRSETEYHYRVIGITPFGDEGLPCEPIIIKTIDFSGPLPPTNVVSKDIGKNTIELTWEANQISSDQEGFAVWRSDSPTGPYYPIHDGLLPNKTRSYKDKTALPVQSNYYIIYAVDKMGNKNGSTMNMAVWYDTIPPAQPIGFSGYIDTLGLVTLAWAYGKEPDLLGYMIYWSHGPDREFHPVNNKPVEGNIFLDSINLRTTSETICYKLVAVDFNMNPSVPSEVLTLEKPDINPPARPLLIDFKAYADSIYIGWSPSPSEDVIGYQVLRKLSGQEKYDIIATLTDLSVTQYMDRTVKNATSYEYAMVAIDDAGNYSELSDPFKISSLRGLVRKPIHDLMGRVNETTAELELQWSHNDKGEYQYQVYRNIDAQGWKLISTLKSNEKQFIDRNLYRAQTGFSYAVKVIHKDGGESPMSNIVTLQMNQ